MTDDAKEWVTIKIPKTVRNQARDDARTYGQIMRAGLQDEPFTNDDIEEFKEAFEGATMEGVDVVPPGVPSAEEIAEELEDILAQEGVNVDLIAEQVVDLMAAEGVGVGYDDVVAASRQALREELPGEALQG